MKNWSIGIFFAVLCFCLASVVHGEDAPKPVKNQLIIVNKAVNHLEFYEDGEFIREFPVATGATIDLTPEGKFQVIVKWVCPIYYKTMNKPCASNAPLGPRFIGLSVPGTEGYTYGIHGTNADWTIGTYASHGCVRMHNEDVIWLFGQVEKGATVIITRSPLAFDQIAANNGYLMVEAKATPSNAVIYFDKSVSVYQSAKKTTNPISTLNPQSLIVSKQYKNWYYIEKGSVKGWIKDDAIKLIPTMVDLLKYHWEHAPNYSKYSQTTQVIKSFITKLFA